MGVAFTGPLIPETKIRTVSSVCRFYKNVYTNICMQYAYISNIASMILFLNSGKIGRRIQIFSIHFQKELLNSEPKAHSIYNFTSLYSIFEPSNYSRNVGFVCVFVGGEALKKAI